MASIGERLAVALRQRGQSAAELARQLGVSQPTVHGWLHGQHGLRRTNAAKVADAVGVPLTWLLFGNDPDGERTVQGTDELALLRLYRAADDDARQAALRLLARGR